MRLIDADLLEEILDVNIQKLQDEIDDARTYIQKGVYEAQLFSTMEMIRVIREQPTAFDVEKVVEQLEKESYYTDIETDREVVNLNEAIEIIKRGVIDEVDN